jgi:cell division protein FtsA
VKGIIIKTGIDLGSKAIKVVVTAEHSETGKVEVLGATKELSAGIVNGQVVSIHEAIASMKRAIEKTEQALKLKIIKVAVGINTSCTKHTLVRIRTTVAKASNEISDLDLEKSKLEALKTIPLDSPFELLHTHISSVTVDGRKIKGSVVGTIGHTLEVHYILTTIPKKSLENILSIFENLKLEVVEVNSNAFVSSTTLLDKRDMLFGVGILDIGSDNTSFTMYENGYPVSVRTYNIGGNTFNKDISVGLGIKMEEAESVKRNLKPSDPKKLFTIIDARIDDFVDIVRRDVDRVSTDAQLANGIILSGGGANLYEIREKLKSKLKLPVTDGKDIISKTTHHVLKDPSWTNAYASSLVNFREDTLLKTFSRLVQEFLKNLFQKLAP